MPAAAAAATGSLSADVRGAPPRRAVPTAHPDDARLPRRPVRLLAPAAHRARPQTTRGRTRPTRIADVGWDAWPRELRAATGASRDASFDLDAAPTTRPLQATVHELAVTDVVRAVQVS